MNLMMLEAGMFISLLIVAHSVTYSTQHFTTVTVSGYSSTDQFDRIFSVYHQGVEVARVISPRLQSPPNSFDLTVQLPFSDSDALSVVPYEEPTPSSWNVSVKLTNPSGRSAIEPLIPLTTTDGGSFTFMTTQTEPVFFIVSGHNFLENANGLLAYVDGTPYVIPNWHDQPLYTQGCVIKYIQAYLQAGTHVLSFSLSGGVGSSYLVVSAFGVEP